MIVTSFKALTSPARTHCAVELVVETSTSLLILIPPSGRAVEINNGVPEIDEGLVGSVPSMVIFLHLRYPE